MADPVFTNPVNNPFGIVNVGFNAKPLFADIDGDGDLDLFLGDGYGTTRYFRNTGNATAPAFVAINGNLGLGSVADYAAPALFDIDFDGDLDAFVGSIDGAIWYFRNGGVASAPSFVSAVVSNPFGLSSVGSFSKPVFADLNGNGTPELYVGGGDGNIRAFNLGYLLDFQGVVQPSFTAAGTNPFGLAKVQHTASPTFADVDGDGDLDALIGSGPGDLSFFRNTGNAHAPAFVLEPGALGLSLPWFHTGPTLVDIDGDGDVDVFVGDDDGNTIFYTNALPGIRIQQSSGSTVVFEGGASDSYTVALKSAPVADVTILLDTTNQQVTTSVASLTFTTANWNVAQQVTVTAINDPVGEGAHAGVVRHVVTSMDTGYHGLAVTPLRVAVRDNDLPALDPDLAAPVINPFGLGDIGDYANPALVDIDADGDLDAFVGGLDGITRFFRNTGSVFLPAFASEAGNFGLAGVGSKAAPRLVDIDGDGDLDAFVGGDDGITRFFRNTGSASAPAFASEAGNFGLTDVGSVANPTFADIDGDGDLDAFFGEGNGSSLFFRNTGNFSAPAFIHDGTNRFGLADVGSFSSPTFADIDGDGDLDAFIGVIAGDIRVFRNDFNSVNPSFVSQADNFGLDRVADYGVPVIVDIDADGDLDVFVGNKDGNIAMFLNGNIVLQPPGVQIVQSGGSTKVTEGGATDSYTVVLDRAPSSDVTITLDNTNNQVTTGAASLTFTNANWDVAQMVTVTAVDDTVGEGPHTGVIRHVVTSLDGVYNGLAVAPVRVSISDNDLPAKDPVFGAPVANPFGLGDVGSVVNPVFADIDGDGDQDAFIANNAGDIQFFLNVGNAKSPSYVNAAGNFGLTFAGGHPAPALADIDGDGDLDVFVADNLGNIQFFRNAGSATAASFVAEMELFGLVNVGFNVSPAFADIDGDGDLDAFLGEGEEVLFFRNTGTADMPAFASEAGSFGLANLGVNPRPAFADVDGDGDLDAFIGSLSGVTQFFRNTGNASAPGFASAAGNFGLTNVGVSNSPTFVDIDGDGDIDGFAGQLNGDTVFFRNNAIVAAASDFDGDGQSDVLLRNIASGVNTVWKSAASANGQDVSPITNPDWKVVGLGDFGGDGKSDILWRNSVNGQNVVWGSASSAMVQPVNTLADPSWRVVGVGDFDGDGRADILWRNSGSGVNILWKSGNSATSEGVLPLANLDWKVVGVGDFDGDGQSDILWRNSASGVNAIWRSADGAKGQILATLSDPSWKVAGVGDFDGDGRSDILWRNASTGVNAIWKSGNSATGMDVSPVSNQDWQIAAVGDYGGDGKADILWRNSVNGQGVIWHSGNSATPQAFSTLADLNWKVVPAALRPKALHDFDGDGRSDMLWRNTANGSEVIWKSAKSATVQSVNTLGDQNWKVMALGDFDGDGRADILWRNTSSGANTIWKSGNSATSQKVSPLANQDWKIMGAGDFDGDGRADILWRNTADGQASIWKSGNSATIQMVSTLTDQNWKVAGIGDFDGDQQSDILWRNTATGVNTIWKSGNSVASLNVLPLANQEFKVVGVGDFDGDGKSDILWRNTNTGVNAIWKSANGATPQAVSTLSDLNWQVVGTGDYDGDGRSDILWRNTSTGTNAIWKSGNSATPQAVSPITDQNWAVLDGLESGDILRGGNGANTLHGTINSDVLYGGPGADVMTGGLGADLFRYLNPNEGQDSITDFVPGVDKLQVLGSGFGGLSAGVLPAGNFVSGAAPVATQANQFLYNTTTGMLAFDADGAGGAAAVNLVTLLGIPALTAADLQVAGA